MITLDYRVRLGQVKSEFKRKSPKLTLSIRASKLSVISMQSHSVLMRLQVSSKIIPDRSLKLKTIKLEAILKILAIDTLAGENKAIMDVQTNVFSAFHTPYLANIV